MIFILRLHCTGSSGYRTRYRVVFDRVFLPLDQASVSSVSAAKHFKYIYCYLSFFMHVL